MGFFEPSVMGGGGGEGGMRAPHHDFVVIAPIIMKFGTSVKVVRNKKSIFFSSLFDRVL